MRLHHLEVTAFGPFADTVRVDFDTLSDAGLFLLAGPTGAGKSSVLDAICFALYGDVPGDRAGAKRLRCDQAEEGVAPRVVLDATLSGRRFRIDRSPSWQRPKRRGTGLTSEHAHVVVSERCPDTSTWKPLSTRLDEAGHLITRLVGMNLTQFCQVALLPQGRFQAFLRASSEERHALLQQLFSTGRFDDVEAWLRNRRVTLRREDQAHETVVADQLSRISEVTASAVPEGWTDAPDVLGPWAAEQVDHCQVNLSDAEDAWASSVDAESAAFDAHQAAVELRDLRRRASHARRELARLDAESARRALATERLEAARRAEGLLPLHAVLTQREASAREADLARTLAVTRLQNVIGRAEAELELPALRRSAVAGQADVSRALPLESRRRELAESRRDLHRQVCDHAALVTDLRAERASLSPRIESLREQVATREAVAHTVPERRLQLEAARARHAAAERSAQCQEQVEFVSVECRATRDALQVAKESWLDLRERRLDGMAAEIAADLVVGGCCPVCGSAEHPRPAAAEPDAPDREAERMARKEVDDLEVVLEAQSQQLRELESQLATARGAAGSDTRDLSLLIIQSEAALQEAEAALGVLDHVRREIDVLQAQQRTLATELERVTELHSSLTAAHDVAEREHELATHQIEAVLVGTDFSSLEEMSAHLSEVETCCLGAEAATALHGQALAARDEARASVVEAALAAGFPGLDAALAAALTDDATEELTAWVAAHDRARDEAESTLADPDVLVSCDRAEPDVDALAARLGRARQACIDLRGVRDSLSHRESRLVSLTGALDRALAGWAPVRADLQLTADLAAFVEGKSPDNSLQMRLSAYVLAHRLSQVVDAANLRLVHMTDERFTLVHTGRRGAGERRGGLSLLVRDDWSGESRDPATLSGGETFVVSLALALGLADVISAEAGGAELNTLFVDEGFGSLDADTLDDVLDTLDSLRDGGRVVGVVSHVPEMQIRIPTQLRILKARRGSRVIQ